MVHVKRVELTNFKSCGGTTSVPLLPGFTVISSPNGSVKSHILDALLFCLELSSSQGMGGDRLPDVVNNPQKPQGHPWVFDGCDFSRVCISPQDVNIPCQMKANFY